MGLPVARLVIATNLNDSLPRALGCGIYEPKGVIATSSPSMDIQLASNFERLLFELAGRDPARVRALMGELRKTGAFRLDEAELAGLRALFSAHAIGEHETEMTIRGLVEETGMLVDPHTAVAVAASREESGLGATPMVVLSTAHPAKFPEAVERACGRVPEQPERLRLRLGQHERCAMLPNDFGGDRELHRDQCPRGRQERGKGQAPRRGARVSVERSELANGLTVVSHSMAEVETVSLGIWVGAGSRSEAASEHGVAHFLEHMAFKGTARRSAKDIAEEIEAVGGDLNAATGVDSTAYYARVLRKDLALALDILSDIIVSPRFDRAELGRERDVILQEIAAALDSPEDIAFDLVQEAAFPDQPVGRPILGTVESVSRFKRAHLGSYLAAHYHGPNMVLAAAGAVDHAALVAEAERRLGSFDTHATPQPESALYAGGARRSEKSFEQTHLVLAFQAPGLPSSRLLHRADLRRRARRRHVLAAVPGSARAARALLRHLFLLQRALR